MSLSRLFNNNNENNSTTTQSRVQIVRTHKEWEQCNLAYNQNLLFKCANGVFDDMSGACMDQLQVQCVRKPATSAKK